MDQSEILNMSDEDFEKMSAPPVVEAPASTPDTEVQPPEPSPASTEVPEVTEPATTTSTEEVEPVVPETSAAPATETTPAQEPAAAAETAAEAPATEEQAFDYKAAYENLLKPIKANGKEIQLKSVDELIQLAQQGANYTRKMQDLAPHRKTLMMLENNGIDQEQLSFLIDLSKKDPSAIQKFLKDSGVNPLDVDVEAEPTYQGGNHQVSDAEAAFQAALDDMEMSPSGGEVLQHIHGAWDQASKAKLVHQPEILEIMRVQKEEGFYDRISAEIDRRRALGTLPVSKPWLESYKLVGDQMVAAGQLQDLVAKPAPTPQTPPVAATPVATRVAPAKPPVTADSRVAAAAATKTAPQAAKTIVNPLEMDDDVFMEQFKNRL